MKNFPRSPVWPRMVTLLLAAYWIALATATHVPRLPKISDLPQSDKIAHFVAYAALAFLLSWAWTTRRGLTPLGALFALGVAVVYGAIDELTQIPIPGRCGDWRDWCADSLGAVIGIGLFWGLATLCRTVTQRARDNDVS